MGIYYSKTKNINKTPINEVYFGDKCLEEALYHLSELRKDVVDPRGKFRPGNELKIIDNPHLQDFCRSMEDVFNIYHYGIMISGDPNQFNACTLLDMSPKALKRNSKRVIIKDGHYAFNPEYKVCTLTFISGATLCNNLLTDREILAILLHELGHNFFYSISGNDMYTLGLLDTALSYMNILINSVATLDLQYIIVNVGHLALGDKFGFILSKIHEFCIRKVPALVKMEYCWDLLYNGLMQLIRLPLRLINSILLYPYIICNPEAAIIATLGYGAESISDNFATMFGYGPDLGSGLEKIVYNKPYRTEAERIINNAPRFVTNLIGLPRAIGTLPLLLIDCHPSDIQRIQNQIDYLEDELHTATMDKTTKKILQRQIDDLNYTLKTKYYSEQKNSQFNWSKKVTKGMYDLLGEDPQTFKLHIFTGANVRKSNKDLTDRYEKIKLI